MGNRTAKISELSHAIEVSRELMAGRRVNHTWLGQSREVEFLDKESGFYNVTDHIPIWVAAGGPAVSPKQRSTPTPSSTASDRTST